jgi:uncharacterized integral membrane protein
MNKYRKSQIFGTSNSLMSSRKAQVTIFIIAGIVILLIAGTVIYINQQGTNIEIPAAEQQFRSTPIGRYVTDCAEKSTSM